VKSTEVVQRLTDVASKYMQPDEIARCVLVAASRNPKIADCTQASILRCMMEASILGIRPGGFLGRGWLIPRFNVKIKAFELDFDPGWRGLADIARRSKVVKRIEARIVHQRDHFREVEGTSPRLEHEPYAGDEDPGEIRAAYAIAFFDDGSTQFEVLWRRDLERIRAASETKEEPGRPWHDWPEEMSRKSAVRRLCKHLPTDEELEYALEVATRAEMPGEHVAQIPEAQDKPRAQQLADKIRAERGGAPAAPNTEPNLPDDPDKGEDLA
jgi:recombination protein RecT